MKKSILIYTDGEIMGDGIIKIPFAVALKKAMPECNITWLCSGSTLYNSILSPLVKDVIDDVVLFTPQQLSWRGVFGALPFTDRRFDIIIDTQKKLKRTLWLKRIPHDKFYSKAVRYMLSEAKPSNRSKEGGGVFDDLMTLGSMATGVDLIRENIEIPAEFDEKAKHLLPDGKSYIGFVVGAGKEFKLWALENHVRLAKELEAKGKIPVFITGPNEKDIRERLGKAIPTALFPLDGEKDPRLTIAIGKRLSAAVSTDSGGGHLICAGGDFPIVTLFGTLPLKKKFLPASSKVTAFCPADFGGSVVSDIPYEAVKQAIIEVL